MRYYVTLATKTFELLAFDVDGASEAEAVAVAQRRLFKQRPWLNPFEIGVAKIVRNGSSPPRRRARRKRSPAPLRAS